MIRRTQHSRAAASLLACFLGLMLPLSASDNKPGADSGESKTTAAPASQSSDIEQLKEMLREQQQQINELRRELASQKKSDPPAAAAAPAIHQSLGDVASTTGAIPPAPAAPEPTFNPPAASPSPQQNAAISNDGTFPTQLKIGNAYITPVGFMDMTAVSRSTNPGSGIGTNFGSIPYANTQGGSLTETRLSIQNSRIGARIDANVAGTKVLGYWESDFLGQLGNPPNGGLAVSSNPYVFRMRLYWVDVTKGKFEFLAGQSWSLMTPNRTGISPLPGDLFYSQDIDVNYQAGLVWGRIPGFRFGFHPSDKVAIGIALENSEPYVGGGNGGSAITAPAAIASILGSQVNNGSSVISAAALAPDIIAKVAFDPSRRFHIEIAGVLIANKISDPASTPVRETFSKTGGGGSVNLNFALTKNLRIVTNNFYSAGGGRYIFGQAPDFMIRADGSLSLVHSGSTVSGLEFTAGKTLFYGYYGGVYIGQNVAFDANGKSLIGYGALTSDGQNRAIQEVTFGTNTTLMKDAKWGAINLMFQYSYLQRNPWLVASGAPSDAHLSMGFVNLRYTLPGASPAVVK